MRWQQQHHLCVHNHHICNEDYAFARQNIFTLPGKPTTRNNKKKTLLHVHRKQKMQPQRKNQRKSVPRTVLCRCNTVVFLLLLLFLFLFLCTILLPSIPYHLIYFTYDSLTIFFMLVKIIYQQMNTNPFFYIIIYSVTALLFRMFFIFVEFRF